MIPIGWDDGFSQVIEGVITVRPMLHDRQVQYKEYLKHVSNNREVDPARILFRSPNYFGPKYETLGIELKKKCILAIQGYTLDQEKEQLGEILRGVTLLVEKPNFARLSCDTCRQYCVTDEGELIINPDGRPAVRPPIGVPCEKGRFCPKGHHSNPVEVTGLVRKAWTHFWQWNANLNTCPIMARNASLIRWILNGRSARSYPLFGGSGFIGATRGIIGSPPINRSPTLREGGDAEGSDVRRSESGVPVDQSSGCETSGSIHAE